MGALQQLGEAVWAVPTSSERAQPSLGVRGAADRCRNTPPCDLDHRRELMSTSLAAAAAAPRPPPLSPPPPACPAGLAWGMIAAGVATFVALMLSEKLTAPYGR